MTVTEVGTGRWGAGEAFCTSELRVGWGVQSRRSLAGHGADACHAPS